MDIVNEAMSKRLRETAAAFRREAEEWEDLAVMCRRRADEIERQAADWDVYAGCEQ